MQDTRFAWRTLRRSPGFTLTAIVTLALGIGVNIGMFSLVNGLLLRPLYERPDEVVEVHSRSTTPDGGHRGVSYPNYLDLREGTTDIFAEPGGLVATVFVGLDAGDGPRRTMAFAVTANYFQVFGAPLALGRPFTAEEERPGADVRVAIISYSLWQQRGADPTILGRHGANQRRPVHRRRCGRRRDSLGRAFPGRRCGCRSARTTGSARARRTSWRSSDGSELAYLVETCRPGTRHRRAVDSSRRFPSSTPATRSTMSPPSRLMFMPGSGSGAIDGAARPAPDGHAGDRPARRVPQPRRSAAGARSRAPAGTGHQVVARRRPMAPHSSTAHRRTAPRVGRRRGRAAAVDVGDRRAAGVAASCAPRRLEPSRHSISTGESSSAQWGSVMAATLVFGAWPAWSLTGRAVVTDLKRHVGEEGRQPGGIRIGNALVIGQVALSLLLLASGGLFLMSAISAATADPGFRPRWRIARGSRSESGRVRRSARDDNSHLALVDRLRTVPGVEAVTHRIELPVQRIRRQSRRRSGRRAPMRNRDQSTPCSASSAATTRESSDFHMLAGRDFSDAELLPGSAERVAIIDDALAQRLVAGRRTHSDG